jgi:hypothetical protein
MNIQRATPVNELLAKLIFLILPTAIVGYFLLQNANEYFSILRNQAQQQTLYFAAGMGAAAIFYAFRFRFLPSFIVLVLILTGIYKGLDKVTIGEFDSFFVSVQFLVFAILFTAGWVIGWGFVRWRYWSVLVSSTLLVSCILIIAKANADSVWGLLRAFAPAVLYAVYIIFTAEQIYSYKDKSQKFWWFLTRRLAIFAVLAVLLLGGVVYLMRAEIKETVANYGGSGKSGNSMLEKKGNDFDLKRYTKLSSSLGRSNDLLFCAHIDNFFPGTNYPNPLYLTAFYYTKFDTLTEIFERDSTIPSNDLFEPNPSTIPLFSTESDSSVIKNSLSDMKRKIVDIEVYSANLSPTTYLAPNVGYFVQPITVEKDFRKEFKTAFRAKSYVSELNSAYFVYNIPKPDPKKFQGQQLEVLKQIAAFQEMRFAALRLVPDYSKMDKKFMKYYTFMPADDKFKQISELAHKITDTAKNTTVDKVLAIRNYFMSTDENGEKLYHYSDNPGVPDIPSASKLMYFLNENHKGYCAYFAGATLFMLRSLGIPSRIAVGFLTEDRSDKNKGWYWYYANQAHAWVQVYFPGYGWLDFDTTVGNDEENRDTPKPDGTPPMQPPKAWLATDGIVESVDTTAKRMRLKVAQMVFHDKEYKLEPTTIDMDMKIATVRIDSNEVPMSNIHVGDSATAVSYAEAMKQLEPGANESGKSIVSRFPDPAPIDEVYLKRKIQIKKEEQKQVVQKEQPTNWRKIIWMSAGITGGVIVLFLLLPILIFGYYLFRHGSSKTNKNKAYWAYRTAGYYMNQLGVYRGQNTPMQFANKIVDPAYGTSFTSFMNAYLKQKYAKQQLSANEQEIVNKFLKNFINTVRKKTEFKKRFFSFMNPMRSISFFVVPEDEKEV